MADGVALLRLARGDRAAAVARLRELGPEELAAACQELRAESRAEFLMLVPRPEDVLPLLAEAELVQTVRAGGMSDAAWLLELATPEQRLACFDLDCWTGEQPALDRVHEWLDALIEAGRPTLVHALDEMDLELLILALRAETRVAVVAKEDEAPEGWYTPDGVVYFGFTDAQSPHRVHEVVQALFETLPALYWRLVYGLLFEPTPECEEDALRWRTNRLADLGFPDRAQAMRVYRPLRADKVVEQPAEGTEAGALVRSIALPRAADVLGYVLGVANALAVADGLSLADSDSVPRALEKAVRGIDAGLRELTEARSQPAEEVLERTTPLDLFRVGATRDPALRPPPLPAEPAES